MWFSVKESGEFGRRADLPVPANLHQTGSESGGKIGLGPPLIDILKHFAVILSIVSD